MSPQTKFFKKAFLAGRKEKSIGKYVRARSMLTCWRGTPWHISVLTKFSDFIYSANNVFKDTHLKSVVFAERSVNTLEQTFICLKT